MSEVCEESRNRAYSHERGDLEDRYIKEVVQVK